MISSTIALPSLDNQLTALDLELKQLAEQIAEKEALKKAIAEKKEEATAALLQLESALKGAKNTFERLGESTAEFQNLIKSKLKEYFPNHGSHEENPSAVQLVEDVEEELVSSPPQTPQSNKYFSFELTSSPHVAYFFNVAEGKNQSVYVGSNNKQNLKSVEANLMKIFDISCSVRKAKQLDFAHELKIVGLEDDDIGWLTGFDFSQKFYPQFACVLPIREFPQEERLSEEHPEIKAGIAIAHNYLPTTGTALKATLIEYDNFGKGTVETVDGLVFESYLSNWHILKTPKDTCAEPQNLPSPKISPSSNQKKTTQITFEDGYLQIKFDSRNLLVAWRDHLANEGLIQLLGETPQKDADTGYWILNARTVAINFEKIERLDFNYEPDVIVHDYGAVVAKIDVLMNQLNWSKDDGKKYILDTYGKKSRLYLSDDELLDFQSSLAIQLDSLDQRSA